MTTCPKCNAELIEGTKFCGSCGSQVVETAFCGNCGMKTSADAAFCPSCGARIKAGAAETNPKETAPRKKRTRKIILFAGAAIMAVAALAAAAVLLLSGMNFSNGKAQRNDIAYVKDDGLFYNNLKKNSESWEVTSKLQRGDTFASMYYWGYQISTYTYMSEDGKYIFFPDKMDKEVWEEYTLTDVGINLFYQKVSKPEEDAVKIDSDVHAYMVNDAATVVTYLKGDNGNLYQYNMADATKEKIASEVKCFSVSDDGKKIVYLNSDYNLYVKYANKDKEKIAGDIDDFEYISEDLSTVYYVKDDSLYRKSEGADKEKIASDVYSVVTIYDSGEIYFVKEEQGEIHLLDYVIDDMKDADASVSEPAYPNYPQEPKRPYSWYYDTDAEYEEAYAAYTAAYAQWQEEYARMYAEYEEAYLVYSEKADRDYIRTELESETMEWTAYSLYYYDGRNLSIVTEDLADDYFDDCVFAFDAPVITYRTFNWDNMESVKLSEFESVSDIWEVIFSNWDRCAERYVAVKEKETILEQEKRAASFAINDAGTQVFYLDNISDDSASAGDLYRIMISNGIAEKPEVMDSDVWSEEGYFLNDNDFVYYKDFVEDSGDLGQMYINGELIDSDVSVYSDVVEVNDNGFLYMTDTSSTTEGGTLKFYDGTESIKIADDVSRYDWTDDGRIFYICDYSQKYYKGDLYEWSDGETRRIDDDVVGIIFDVNGDGDKYRGFYTYQLSWW